MDKPEIAENIQKMAVKLLATSPAGEGLCLIGGFRYRWLDQSCRRSVDLDYHWDGGLKQKQEQVIVLFQNNIGRAAAFGAMSVFYSGNAGGISPPDNQHVSALRAQRVLTRF